MQPNINVFNKINHVSSEVGFQNFTGQPGQWIADFTGQTAKPLATGHWTSVNFDPCISIHVQQGTTVF